MSLIRSFLQGKWLGHPLHPALVHIPTALFPATLGFDVASRIAGDNTFVRLSFYCIGLGLIVSLASAVTGLADLGEIKQGKPARSLALRHLKLNLVVTALFALNFMLRVRSHQGDSSVGIAPLMISAGGAAVVAVAVFVGGRMVFEHGVGVARFSKERWRKRAEAAGANLPAES